MDTDWFDDVRDRLEAGYLQHSEPWRQSGFSGPEDRWTAARKPIADCVEHSGSFLDIGCANGYLLQCVLKWTAERGLTVTPYGLDLSEKLIGLAKTRLPEFCRNLHAGNSWDWEWPTRFSYVRTELVYVPPEWQREYIRRILRKYLTVDGVLMVAEYRSRTAAAHGHPSPVDHVLLDWGFSVVKVASGFWEGKEITRVAMVRNHN